MRVKFIISCAMSVSRIRLSEADRFSTATLTVVDGVLEPVLHRTELGALGGDRGDPVLHRVAVGDVRAADVEGRQGVAETSIVSALS